MAEQSVVRLFPEPAEELPPGSEALSDQLRAVEALLFASAEPVSEAELAKRLPEGTDVGGLLRELEETYAGRGVNLTKVARGWAFRTSPDLSYLMTREVVEQRRLSRAALEMLAIIAYHQPVTRNEIEEIRGVSTSKGTLDLLIEIGWVRISGRRNVPGRPVTYSTSDAFLQHFSLDRVTDLPGVDELAAAGLLDKNPARTPADEIAAEDDEPTDSEEPFDDGAARLHDEAVATDED